MDYIHINISWSSSLLLFKMSKRTKVIYNRGDGVITIIVTDETGKKDMLFRANQSDKDAHTKIATVLYEKYGINFSPTIKTREERESDFFTS